MALLTVQIEESLLNQALGLLRKQAADQALETLKATNPYELKTAYRSKTACALAELCDKYGSDKGTVSEGPHPYPWRAHTYTDYYSGLFGLARAHVRNVFECGLGTNNPDLPSSMGARGKPGASLRAWRDYFPNAQIVGADVDRAILFEEDRIRTHYVDQTNPEAIRELWSTVGDVQFDIMIDDGLHTFEAGACFFQHSFHKLRPGGVYVIEDVSHESLGQFATFFANANLSVEFVQLHYPGMQTSDNNLVVVRHAGAAG